MKTDDSKLMLAILGGIHRPSSVDQEPVTVLLQWQVYEVRKPKSEGWDIHFTGWASYEGRVSSTVLSFDKSTMQGVTRSGRIYKLNGEPGYNSDAEYVWGRWLDMYGNPETRCVTDQYYDMV